MADSIRIAVAQSPVAHDPAANGQAIRALMHSAAQRGARLIHSLEGAATDYVPAGSRTRAAWQVGWSAAREQLELTAAPTGELAL